MGSVAKLAPLWSESTPSEQDILAQKPKEQMEQTEGIRIQVASE